MKKNLGFDVVVRKLCELNPRSIILTANMYGEDVIISMTHPKELKYPEGYYWNSKNGITNKHRTFSGMYENFHIYIMKKPE